MKFMKFKWTFEDIDNEDIKTGNNYCELYVQH